MILESVKHGPLDWPSIEVDDVYALVNHHRIAKDLWEQVQLLMHGTSLTKQEREYRLYDTFDKFSYIKGESFHEYYLRFTQIISDMNIYKMSLQQFQVNTKFLNSLLPEWNFGLAFLVFKQGDDHIDAINKMMSILSIVVTSHFPSTNNQLRNSSNPRQQATIHDGRVTVQPIQGRQSSFVAGTSGTKANNSGTGGNNSGSGKVLNEEELENLTDPRIAKGPITQTIITHNAAYQVDDLNAYDSDCDDFSTAKAVLMANLSSYGSDVLSGVPHSENTRNDMLNQSVQEMSYSEQTHLVNYPENKITNDINIIPYSQYLLETQNVAVQDTNSSV
nr:integrase, catalytic region, zinc finger, CCHC-type, peptidase aspartic, catalytic [Tanacetum cinerariifolium]